MNQAEKLSRFFKGEDIAPGSFINLTIDCVKTEELGQKKEPKDVVRFRESPKGLVLNKSNRITLIALFGAYDEKWVGGKVTLYSCDTRGPNGIARGVRILMRGESKMMGLPPEAEAFMFGVA